MNIKHVFAGVTVLMALCCLALVILWRQNTSMQNRLDDVTRALHASHHYHDELSSLIMAVTSHQLTDETRDGTIAKVTAAEAQYKQAFSALLVE